MRQGDASLYIDGRFVGWCEQGVMEFALSELRRGTSKLELAQLLHGCGVYNASTIVIVAARELRREARA